MSTTANHSPARVRFEQDSSYRHWSPESQTYATADIVQQMLDQGWQLDNVATAETFHFGSMRHVDVYNFTLNCQGKTQEIPVVNGPLVQRLLNQYNILVRRVDRRPQ